VADLFAEGEPMRQIATSSKTPGFEGLDPVDAAVPPLTSPQDQAHWIFIAPTSTLIANVADYLGSGETDSGSAFEIGFAVASDKPVWAYVTDPGELKNRVPVVVIVDRQRPHVRERLSR
jgi:nucleoside 2-deoxyribosyltransferase